MSESELKNILLVIQDLGLLVTIIGWIYTGGQQRSLLRETREYQRLDREVDVHRKRMAKASEITKSLITSSDWWYKLAALAGAARSEVQSLAFFNAGQVFLSQVSQTRLELSVILYDPEYRALRDLLPVDISKKIYDLLKESAMHIQEFHSKTYFMSPSDPNVADELTYIVEEGKAIGDEIVEVADKFADAFAHLDRLFSKDKVQ